MPEIEMRQPMKILDNYSLEYKDVNTILSDFIYEKKMSDVLILTFL